MGLSSEQRELARHALGLTNGRKKSFRNRFVTDAGSDGVHQNWDEMVISGCAKVKRNVPVFGGMDFFELTLHGAQLALNPDETLDLEDFPEWKGRAA